MEELRRLIDVLERNSKGASGALLDLDDAQSLETKLYNIVKSIPDLTEKEAASILYGISGKADAFKMMKSRVKKKLYNQLHFTSLESINLLSAKHAADIKCNALINHAIILDRSQQQELSDKLISQAIIIAKEVDNTASIIRALELRRENYCYHNPNQKLFNKIDSELQSYYAQHQHEIRASGLYQRCLLEIRISVETRYNYSDQFKTAVDELYELWIKTGSSAIYSYYYYVFTAYLELIGDYHKLVSTLQELLSLLDAKKLNNKLFNIPRIRFHLTYAYLKSKCFDEGLKQAEETEKMLPADSFNWFAHMENYFLLAVHSKKYDLANSLLNKVNTCRYFDGTTTVSKERWAVLNKFFRLINGDFTQPSPGDRLKYLVQDKAGFNLWSLYYDFVRALLCFDADLIERETERLRKYTAKHLATRGDDRSRLFIKLLAVAGKEYNNVSICKRKGRYLLTKLEQTPVAGDAYAETEIIPYEHLWEFILQKIGRGR